MAQSQFELVRALPHLHKPRTLHFPESAEMPDTKLHVILRTVLLEVLRRLLGGTAAVGSEQFVYFRATDPGRCLAPDAFVKLGVADSLFRTWKTWELGAPDLAVEVASESDTRTWDDKLESYREMGVRELVRFDPDMKVGSRIRVWDRIEEDLVERGVQMDRTPCVSLGHHWVVAPVEGAPVALRLARDPAGEQLVLTAAEAERDGRLRAEARVAELEAELLRRGGGQS